MELNTYRVRVKDVDLKFYRYARLDGKQVTLHRARATKALGKALPAKAVVHHVDEGRPDNSRLVICQDQRYHFLLHVRQRTIAAGGNPNTQRVCCSCKSVKPFSAWAPKALAANQCCRECNTKQRRPN